jgi:outer membrane biosynthesis protein TonB
MLRLHWDPNAPAVRKADRGVLWITDGARRKHWNLDSGQLIHGSVAYWPSATDVDFYLEIFSGGQPISESIRVLSQELFPAPAPAESQLAKVAPQAGAKTEPRVEESNEDYKPSPFGRSEPPPRPATDSAERAAPENAPAPQIALLPKPEPEAIVPRQPPEPVSVVTYEPVQPSAFRRVVGKVPLVRRLQKNRYKYGEGFAAARPIRQVSPPVPPSLKHELQGAAPVDLKVHIDRGGKVWRTELLSEEADNHLVKLAMTAARQWQFSPARWNGQNVSSEMILHFVFKNAAE